MAGSVGYAPTIEGSDDRRSLPHFLEENPKETLNNGTFKKVPLLTGVTKDETVNGIDLKDIKSIFKSINGFLATLTSLSSINEAMGKLPSVLLPGVGMKYAFLNPFSI